MLKVVAATNNALQPSTIATYLTQMWIGNILQVIILEVTLKAWKFLVLDHMKTVKPI